MGTTALPQVDPTALDTAGLSIATTYVEDNPRSGIIYEPTTVAAAAPIWFHPLADGTHLMVMARRWHTATPGGGMGTYGAHTEDLSPSWVVVDGPRGSRSGVTGQSLSIPIDTTMPGRTLIGAASRAPDYLYLLYGTETSALVQRIRIHNTGAVAISVEEMLPTLVVEGEEDPVVFNKGVQMSTPHLFLYGTDSTGVVYRMRKLWALLGSTRPSPAANTPDAAPVWEYYTGTGYSADPTLAAPVESLTTVGPLGFGAVRATQVITTVSETGGNHTGVFWTSTRGRPLRKLGITIPLGDTDQYLGHGLLPQPEIAPQNALSSLALPYLSTKLITIEAEDEEDNEFSLTNTWGLLPIS